MSGSECLQPEQTGNVKDAQFFVGIELSGESIAVAAMLRLRDQNCSGGLKKNLHRLKKKVEKVEEQEQEPKVHQRGT